MSFETTATIANFGGKLLKLAHQVSTQNMHNHTQLILTTTSSPKQPQPK
jgi:S-formylglutathione hydrolase